MIQIRSQANRLLLPVRVTPKGGKDLILPFTDEDTAIRLKVSAPPEDGKANASVEKLLASVLGVSKSQVSVVRGEKSREKQVAVSFHDKKERDLILNALLLAADIPQKSVVLAELG